MNASTLLRLSFAAVAMAVAGLSDASAQQPRFRGRVPGGNPAATDRTFAPRSTISESGATVRPAAGPSARPVAGAASAWAPADMPRPVLLIDPKLSSYEMWAQFDGPGDSSPPGAASVRHRERGQVLNQFSHRDGIDYR